ncbi:MAG: hypothetical protein K2K32_09450 [Muribaculaceae bacterium]|nr:hypothetical protein [Muribaculaceae bacterium]
MFALCAVLESEAQYRRFAQYWSRRLSIGALRSIGAGGSVSALRAVLEPEAQYRRFAQYF